MSLDSRIKEQFPVLIVTLLSVLIGVAFSDLAGIVRARLVLWPLDAGSMRTWGQILTMTGCCLSVWVIFAHLAISRLRIPFLADSVVIFTMPLAIFIGNSLVGEKDAWPWFYWATAYLMAGILTWQWQVRIALKEDELAPFGRLTHPFRAMFILYFGAPFYAIAGWADSHGMLSPAAEALVAMTGGPAAMLTTWIFVRDWHRSIAQTQIAKPQTAAVAAAVG